MGTTSTYTAQMQIIVTKYIAAHEEWPATTRQIAAWAIREKMWASHPSSLVNQCAEALAEAMREEYIIDPQGRTVRAKHAARIDQAVLWGDIRTAPRGHMEVAFKQRRHQIVGDCRQLKADVDSFNENREPGEPIQLSLDFTRDVAELEAVGV